MQTLDAQERLPGDRLYFYHDKNIIKFSRSAKFVYKSYLFQASTILLNDY